VTIVFVAIVLFVVAIVAVFATIAIYNRLIAFKNAAEMTWSNVHVLLKQRHDELPKLVEICKQYMKYEQSTLERVVAARGAVYAANESGNVKALGAAEADLRSQLGKLFAVAEAYPDLKASTIFLQLQTRISGLETSIADRREIYNDAVNSNNTAIEQFPAVLIANMFGFRPFDLFEFDAESIADVDVKALLSAAQN
jgi:LemA protein